MGGSLSFTRGKTSDAVDEENDGNIVTVKDRILGTIYGNCIGDAIGLLTEFMIKEEAKKYYGKKVKTGLQFSDKVPDMHRMRWKDGDWTDDSDQMILILQMLLDNNGKVDNVNFARRMVRWRDYGNPDHGDFRGMGIGQTTGAVLNNPVFLTDPHKAAEYAWEGTNRYVAANGALMRTSILGTHQYSDLDAVIANTLNICKCTHYDPRCQASCVAMTTAIALMLQSNPAHLLQDGSGFHVNKIIDDAYSHAVKCLPEGNAEMEKEFHDLIYVKSQKLSLLELDEHNKIGYTYKCLGAGFWALRQSNYKRAMTELIMEAGDADTNGAVAGALLGCKLGVNRLPSDWLQGLLHKDWLDNLITRYLELGGHDMEAGESSKFEKDEGLNVKEEVNKSPESEDVCAKEEISKPAEIESENIEDESKAPKSESTNAKEEVSQPAEVKSDNVSKLEKDEGLYVKEKVNKSPESEGVSAKEEGNRPAEIESENIEDESKAPKSESTNAKEEISQPAEVINDNVKDENKASESTSVKEEVNKSSE